MDTYGIKIRPATTDDLPFLAEELGHFSKQLELGIPLIQDRLSQSQEESLIDIILNHPIFIAENAASIQMGFIGGVLIKHPLNRDIKYLMELFWWVKKEFRGSGAGELLLDYFIGVGSSQADFISIAMEFNTPISDEILLKRGFKLKERTYVLEIH